MYDIIVIGGGPAGLTAAVYARRAGKSVLVIEKSTFGGQITWSPKVENFPSLVSISGLELGDMLMNQAMEQGADMELEEVCAVENSEGYKRVVCESGTVFDGRCVIIATGAKPRMLKLPGEDGLVGNGICFCAVCDGAFYAGKTVAVYGGGNSALQDAMLLSEKCLKVYIIHRRENFRGEAALVEALKRKPNVEFILNSRISGLLGDISLEGVVITGSEGNEMRLALDGLFVCIGHQPDLGAFGGILKLDEKGYADSDENCLSPTDGVFVAGDCRSKKIHQLTTAVADGSVAALAACAWLDRR